MEFLIDSGSSVNIINRDTFEKLESLMSLTLERSCVKVYPYGCKSPLPILGKCVIEICSNCTDKRTFATFHVIDAAISCIHGKSASDLLYDLTVLHPTRSKRISALANLDFEYRLESLLRWYKDIFGGTGALKISNLLFKSILWYSRVFKNQESYHFSRKNELRLKFKSF